MATLAVMPIVLQGLSNQQTSYAIALASFTWNSHTQTDAELADDTGCLEHTINARRGNGSQEGGATERYELCP